VGLITEFPGTTQTAGPAAVPTPERMEIFSGSFFQPYLVSGWSAIHFAPRNMII